MSRQKFRGREDYAAFRTITTRWMDNDVYGHVNNVVYYSWFDTAVNAHLIEAGVLDIHGGEVIGLVVETACRYAKPLAFPQLIEAGIRTAHVGTSSVRYEVGLFAAGEVEAAAEGCLCRRHFAAPGAYPGSAACCSCGTFGSSRIKLVAPSVAASGFNELKGALAWERSSESVSVLRS